VAARHGLAHAAGRRRAVFEELGGTFIKLGQMLSLQPDLVSREYCDALFNLLDRVAPFGMADVERTFVEELGRSPAEVFDSFDPEPIATASVGQVHVAYLRGRKVAVKVQRPCVGREFGGDISLMGATVRLIDGLGVRRLGWLADPLREFTAWTREEMDFRREAGYMDRLRRNAHDNPAERVPEVFWDYTTPRVLVMEFLDGVTVLNYLRAVETGDTALLARLSGMGFDPGAFSRNIIDNFLGDVFRHGMFHADLHPANLMILPGNVVGYLDFGITGVLSRYSRRHLIALTLAYTRGDTEGMCESFFRVSAVAPGADADGFREGLRRLADEWYEVRGRERQLRKTFTGVMLDMMRLSRVHGVSPERDVIKYIRSAIAGDGLITRFAPGFDVGGHLARACGGHLRGQSWAELVSYEAMLNWLTSGSALVQDGALRGAGFVRRLAAGELTVRADVNATPADGDAPARRRALGLAGVAFLAALLVVVSGEPPAPGKGLFTAEAAALGLALLLLALAVRRIAGRPVG
jgi:ubiquinone biosynthesis protein